MAQSMMKHWRTKTTAVLGSKKIFWFVLGFFVLESAWVALSGRYPMAFDEDFHLGIIKIYAHHLSPFFAHQPANANAFGAVARDPSYLYHYLMSFPFRVVAWLTSSQTAQVLVLRGIDIALFGWGLWLFYKLLGKTGAPRAWLNLALLFFVLVPVVPQLAAQINYDDLLMPLVALALLLTVRFAEYLNQNKRINLRLLGWILILCLLTSLVKYAFLPIFLGIGLYILFRLWRFRRSDPSGFKPALVQSWQSFSRVSVVVVAAGIVLSGGLFFERYGINTIKYHTPIPACDAVLSIPDCTAYSPWERNYVDKLTKGAVNHNQFRFTGQWFYGLFERSFFAVNGPESNFATQPALPILGITAATIGIAGAIIFIIFSRRILRQTQFLGFLLGVGLIYSAVLWLQNYSDFLKYGQPVAINGRYVFPILLPVFLAIALAYRELFKNHHGWRDSLIVVALGLFVLQGGGVETFIIRSDPSWYWPHNRVVDNANRSIRDIFSPIVLH